MTSDLMTEGKCRTFRTKRRQRWSMRRWQVKRADRVEDERRISFDSEILGRELRKFSGW